MRHAFGLEKRPQIPISLLWTGRRERIISRSAAYKGPAFIPTLWVALATALLCALWPAGLPLTKTVGSAFSPATTIVALRGRAEQLRPPVKRFEKDDASSSPAGPPANLDIAVLPKTITTTTRAVERLAWYGFAIVAPPVSHWKTPAWPRGPPQA